MKILEKEYSLAELQRVIRNATDMGWGWRFYPTVNNHYLLVVYDTQEECDQKEHGR